jgi:hypothetical protein
VQLAGDLAAFPFIRERDFFGFGRGVDEPIQDCGHNRIDPIVREIPFLFHALSIGHGIDAAQLHMSELLLLFVDQM